jgi:oligoribonuclease
MLTDRMLWCDTETFGLDPFGDFIIELGFVITDLAGVEVIDYKHWLIWDTPMYDERLARLQQEALDGHEPAQYVQAMHIANGLMEEASMTGIQVSIVEEEAREWLQGHGFATTDPLCGSSVQFDRGMLEAQMPSITALLSYRNVDNSTLKELMTGLAPIGYAQLPSPASQHRVMPDLSDTIAEYRFYRENFLKVETSVEE